MRRRGFTLVELVVYMSLVTTGLMVFAGLELSAQRATAVQGALMDIATQSSTYMGRLRRDVEGARGLRIGAEGKELLVQRLDGTAVIYKVGERIELSSDGKQRGRERFRLLVELEVRQGHGSLVEVRAAFARGEVRRVHVRTAAPRREGRDD